MISCKQRDDVANDIHCLNDFIQKKGDDDFHGLTEFMQTKKMMISTV